MSLALAPFPPYTLFDTAQSTHDHALHVAKHYLDPLASLLAQEHRPAKRLRLKQVHIEGFAAHPVWLQARRILDASLEILEVAVREAVREKEDGKAMHDINMQGGWEEEKEQSHDSDSERVVTSLSTSTSDAEGADY
jgi:hypothetical protein